MDDQIYRQILARLRALHERGAGGQAVGDIAAAGEWERLVGLPGQVSIPRSSKEEGELAELAYSYVANRNGLKTARPEGDLPFDRVSIWRQPSAFTLRTVQVKCTSSHDGNYKYTLNISRSGLPYFPGDFDFLAGLVVPEDAWYIIPFHALRGRTAIPLYPRCLRPEEGGDCERYRNRWELLS